MSCQTCKFASKSAQQINVYECRRHPPSVLPVQGPQGVGFVATFPAVAASCWCGDFVVAPAPIVKGVAGKLDG